MKVKLHLIIIGLKLNKKGITNYNLGINIILNWIKLLVSRVYITLRYSFENIENMKHLSGCSAELFLWVSYTPIDASMVSNEDSHH